MAKTIKFNLICDNTPVRTIEDLQNNFSIEDVLDYYRNGLLCRWLKVRGYDEEVDVTVLEVDMPEPELLEQKTGSPEVTPEDWEKVKPIYTDFMQSYTSHPEQPVEQWLGGKLQEYLPEEPSEEIHKMTDEIVTTLHRNEAMHQSLQEAVANGRSRESWFAAQTQKSISAMSAQEASVYLAGLDKALDTANEQLYQQASE